MVLKLIFTLLISFTIPSKCITKYDTNQDNNALFRIRRSLDNAFNHVKNNGSLDIYSILLEIKDAVTHKITSIDPIDVEIKDMKDEIRKSEEKLEIRIDNILKTSNQKFDILLQAFSGIGDQISKDLKTLEDVRIRIERVEERIFNLEMSLRVNNNEKEGNNNEGETNNNEGETNNNEEKSVKIEALLPPVNSHLIRDFLSAVPQSPQIIALKDSIDKSPKYENLSLPEVNDVNIPSVDILKSLKNDINTIRLDLENKSSDISRIVSENENFKTFLSKYNNNFTCTCQGNFQSIFSKLQNNIQELERKYESLSLASNNSFTDSAKQLSQMEIENNNLKTKIRAMESLISEIYVTKSNTQEDKKEMNTLKDRLTNLELSFSNSQIIQAKNNEKKPGSTSTGLCVYPFIRRAESCFYISKDKRLKWEEARNYCREIQGDLASPKDFKRFTKFLADQKLSRSYTYWVGGSDLEKEEEWKWVDGTKIPMGSEVWATDQPNEGKSSNCMAVRLSSRVIAAMDEDCSLSNYFICEQEKN